MTLRSETLNPVRRFKGRGTEMLAAAASKQGASRVTGAMQARAAASGTR